MSGGFLRNLVAQSLFASMLLASCQMANRTQDESGVLDTNAVRTTKVATSTIYNNHKYNIVTIWHPSSSNNFKGKYLDTNNNPTFAPFPQRFIISDGLLTRAFILVDTTPGSALSMQLDLIAQKLPPVNAANMERIISQVTENIIDLAGNRWTLGVNEAGDNPWDPKRFTISGDSMELFKEAADLPVDHIPLVTKQDFPVVPYENFLTCRTCSAYCIHKALLAKLLFDRLGIKSRFITGALINQSEEAGTFSTDGHSWVEVKSAKSREGYEIVDATQQKRGLPGPRNPTDLDWVLFGSQYRVANQRWPVLRLGN